MLLHVMHILVSNAVLSVTGTVVVNGKLGLNSWCHRCGYTIENLRYIPQSVYQVSTMLIACGLTVALIRVVVFPLDV